MRICVSSIDSDLKKRPGKGRGRVLATYGRAVYLEQASGEIMALVPDEVGNGPGFALIERWRTLLESGIAPGQTFRVADGRVELCGGKATIHMTGAAEWDAHIDVRYIRPLEDLRPYIDGLAAIALRREDGMRGGPGTAMDSKLRDLASAVAIRDPERLKEAAGAVVGLGVGLTPSCDDMLAGMCGFLRAAGRGRGRGGGLRLLLAAVGEAIEMRAGGTTPVSRHFLKSTVRGKFTERVKDVLGAIFAADMKTLERSAERLLEYGASSGADLIFGIVLTYNALTKNGRESKP